MAVLPSGFVFLARTAWRAYKELPAPLRRTLPTTWGTARMQFHKFAKWARPMTWPATRGLNARVVQPAMRATKAATVYLESRTWKWHEEYRKTKGMRQAFDYAAAKAPRLVPYKGVPLKTPLTTTSPPPAAAAPTVNKGAAARTTLQRRATAPPRTPPPTKKK